MESFIALLMVFNVLPQFIIKNISQISDFLIAFAAITSLWFSIKAIRKSDWNSTMGTSPSMILRPKTIENILWIKGGGGSPLREGREIEEKDTKNKEMSVDIEFECFNAGRGVAFNIEKPEIKNLAFQDQYYSRTPLHQTLRDNPFEIRVKIVKTFKEWVQNSGKDLNIGISITYTNDQNTVFCRSTWSANAKPFSTTSNGKLKVRKFRLLNRKSKIEYSPKPF